MEEGPETSQKEEAPPATTEEPPPFDPDPRLVAYLEKGAKPEAESRFKRELRKGSTARSRTD